ncbi:MAG: hypothetical protein IH623_28435 [Verrucomicrobia bacterium]|nr:hypothetical protein [Verrucomicrobiota bacterium]
MNPIRPIQIFRQLCVNAAAMIAMLVLSSGCGPSPANRQFQQQIAETKAKCNASEVRRAVLTVSDWWEDPDRGYIPLEKWPKEVRAIALFPEVVGDIWPQIFETSSGKEALGLVAGGGFGHWGITVCLDTNSVPRAQGKIVPWKHGVYFWRD